MQSRAVRPYPPTAVTFNGQSFPAALSNAAAVNVAWKRRNRLNPVILFPSAADETPETGTEYCVVHEGIEENLGSGTTGSFRFLADGTHTVEVFSRRDGLTSALLTFQTTVTGSEAPPGTAPDAPTDLAASPGIVSNNLSWTAPAGGSAVVGYTIYGLTGVGAFEDAVALGSTTTLDFVHRGAAGGVEWRYWVVAYNGSGVSGESNEATSTAYGAGAGTGGTGVGDPTEPGEEGETYTDVSQQPPTVWVYVNGQWMRQNTYDIAFTWIGQVPSFRTFLRHLAVRTFVLPAELSGSQFKADVAPAADVIIAIKKNGIDIGTLTWNSGQTEPVVVFNTPVTFENDDALELASPLDTWGLRNVFITVAGNR